MANISISNVDLGCIALSGCEYRDGVVVFGGAGTLLPGTILAVDSSSLKFVPFVKGGSTNGNGIPKAVVSDKGVAAEGAGDVPARPIVGGKVNGSRLIIAVDGDGSNVDAAVLDQLRDFGIQSSPVQQIAGLDNQ